MKGFNDAAVTEDSNISIQVKYSYCMIFWNIMVVNFKKMSFDLKALVIQTL